MTWLRYRARTSSRTQARLARRRRRVSLRFSAPRPFSVPEWQPSAPSCCCLSQDRRRRLWLQPCRNRPQRSRPSRLAAHLERDSSRLCRLRSSRSCGQARDEPGPVGRHSPLGTEITAAQNVICFTPEGVVQVNNRSLENLVHLFTMRTKSAEVLLHPTP
jgi:hypothetical protein